MAALTGSRVRAIAGAAALIGLAMVVVATTGCALFGGGVTPVEIPAEPPGIVGEIKSISPAEQGAAWGTVLVEGGEQPAGAVSDKAVVAIVESTLLARDGRWIPPDDLAVGMTVRVWFEGPVAESYPVQGTASFIEVQ